jgi:hypothetical protein
VRAFRLARHGGPEGPHYIPRNLVFTTHVV